ncbi:GDP-mannose 4,6-dehydratase [Haematospirillum sp. H1815]|uniref:GDP-mannose 4,6-dehydratase n=1 Tax=Haematospirillum sp. H1815 TaxID=2723108 RepID=UPI002AC33262|nr:GDP-mannose 4,6-dehydratase [Haematospirillum sp. H1815]
MVRRIGARRVLVTGGAGFLGVHLCTQLLRQGCEVLCVDSFLTGHRPAVDHILGDLHFTVMHHDITLPLSVDVDEIYNLACPASPVYYQRDPVLTIKACVLGAISQNITRARNILGWEPTVSLEDGLRETIDWFRHSLDYNQSRCLGWVSVCSGRRESAWWFQLFIIQACFAVMALLVVPGSLRSVAVCSLSLIRQISLF